ncbi:MAG: HEPN domain-containing protein, partial [Dehalococcoidia bacterium]|nr:HEPN domain-containing protein [Dehalococcoidia bacterium]
MTNEERADRLFTEAGQVAGEMRRALGEQAWNLATRRAQEVVELVVKGLLNELGTEYPRVHDAVPVLIATLERRRLHADGEFLEWLRAFSSRLAELRAPVFYQEIQRTEAAARSDVEGAER